MSKDSPVFGLDTSVVLRLLVGEPIHQAETALRFVETEAAANRPCQVCDLVIAEAYFALHAHYQVPKSEALSALLLAVLVGGTIFLATERVGAD